jgi:hypothetical protein
MNPAIRSSLLNQLADDYGYRTVGDLIEANAFDSVVPGICECGYTTDVEPDSDSGWCEGCDSNTVKSCLVLAGVI